MAKHHRKLMVCEPYLSYHESTLIKHKENLTMRTNKPIIVYVGNEDRATDFMEASDTYVLGAPTLRIALAQTVFSFPNAIIIDAAPEYTRLAEAVLSHLHTITHPPIILLSDDRDSWDTTDIDDVTILPQTTTYQAIAAHLRGVLTGELEAAS
jgi:hypothetical protein